MTAAACRMKSSSSGDDVLRVARHMTGRICGGIAAIGLGAAVMFATPLVGASAASAKELSGADVSRLIMETLAGEGLEGAPGIKPDRIFPACDSGPEIEPMFGSWNTVAVRCMAGSGWRFNIRTNLSSRPAPVPDPRFSNRHRDQDRYEQPGDRACRGAQRKSAERVVDEIEVVALSRSVSRNDMIGAGDLVMVAISERNALGAFFDPADVIGRRVKIGVGVNQPLMARHLHPDFLVEEGNEVLISSSAGGISVDMVGYALENGQIGEWIGVENASSGKMVRGKVTGEKKVTVIAKN